MNNLNLVEIRNNQVVVSSRQVAEKFGKRHTEVLRSIESHVQALQATDAKVRWFMEESYKDKKGEMRKEFLMTRDGFSLLVMSFNNTRDVLQWKMKYIAAFNEMETRLKNNDLALPDFTNPAEAARAWAEQFEKCNKAEQQLKAAEPKVIFADAVSASDTTILIGDLAKLIKQNGHAIGQKRLFQWLRENGFLIKRQGADYNSPTQYAMELGLFKIKETAITHSDGHVTVSKTVKVTGKGQQYFINKFAGKEKELTHERK
jgi:anti-repressor protein